MNKISVIIPVYNVEKYIHQCLDSVVNQTYQNLEILLIDDGSPDRCGEICDEYAAKDERITVLHKKNAGVGAARNDGIKLAHGEWIAFIDPDDWCDTDFFEKMLLAMPDSEIDVLCAGGYIRELSTGQSVRAYSFETPVIDVEGQESIRFFEKVLAPCDKESGESRASLGAPWNKLYRTDFLRENQIGFNTKLHPMEDVLFNLHVFEKSKGAASCDAMGMHYRVFIETSSMNRFNPKWPEMLDIFLQELMCFTRNQPQSQDLECMVNMRVFMALRRIMSCYYLHPNNPKTNREIEKEFQMLKKNPLVHSAIYRHDNSYLNFNSIIYKSMLCLPWIWPLRGLRAMKLRFIRKG